MAGIGLSCSSGRAAAGPWSTQPVVGVAAEYASNPTLASTNAPSETHAALLLDLPMNYDLDTVHFAVRPNVRYSDVTGYSSVTSDYLHLDASAKVASELDAVTLAGALYQDSSLLYAGEVSNGIGVRRDTASLDLNWQHTLTERTQFQLDSNAVRTRYAQSTQLSSLVDYSDAGLSPAFAYVVSEVSTVRLIGGVSRYTSLNGFTASNGDSLQLGWDHHIDELWTLTASAGYSKSTDRYNFGIFKLDTSQNGAVYSVNLTRQAEKLAVILGASKSLTPTGFAFLARQDSANGLVTYNYSERLTCSAGITWANIDEPLITGGSSSRQFYDGVLSANWHLTEQWVLTLYVSKITQQFAAQPGQHALSPTSNGVSFEISRQFHRTNQ